MSRLLILDDSQTVREVIKVYLTGAGFDFSEADNGERALEICKTTPLDLVVADIKMPGMSGIEFVQKLRESGEDRLKALRVILLTGEKGDELRRQGLQAGANAFVEKPVTGPNLRDTITRVMKG